MKPDRDPDPVEKTLLPPDPDDGTVVRTDSDPDATLLPDQDSTGANEDATLLPGRDEPTLLPDRPGDTPAAGPGDPTLVGQLPHAPAFDRTLAVDPSARPHSLTEPGTDVLPGADFDAEVTRTTVAPAGVPHPPTNPTARGAMVGRFAVRGLHARGGLGEVFTARDTELNREVALKRIQSRYADESASRRRFLTEAQLTARLDHPGVVPVFGLVADGNGRPCYAMRFIRGESLKDEIDRYHGKTAGGPATDPTVPLRPRTPAAPARNPPPSRRSPGSRPSAGSPSANSCSGSSPSARRSGTPTPGG